MAVEVVKAQVANLRQQRLIDVEILDIPSSFIGYVLST